MSTRKPGQPKPVRHSVFTARRIEWQDEHGEWHSQSGVPAMVRTSTKCQNKAQRRMMLYAAKLNNVALVPIQWGEDTGNGPCVVCWLALCDGDNVEGMERFLECGLVTWEHCTLYSIPSGRGVHLARKPADKSVARVQDAEAAERLKDLKEEFETAHKRNECYERVRAVLASM